MYGLRKGRSFWNGWLEEWFDVRDRKLVVSELDYIAMMWSGNMLIENQICSEEDAHGVTLVSCIFSSSLKAAGRAVIRDTVVGHDSLYI